MLYKSNIDSALEYKSNDPATVTLTGYASVYNVVDQQNDIIIKGAFQNAIEKNRSIKLLWQHNPAIPIGIVKRLSEDNHGLKIEAIINDKVTAGKEAIELIKQKALDSLSIGFRIKSYTYNHEGQRVITEADLFEVSIVTFPANTEAVIDNLFRQNHATFSLIHKEKKMDTTETLDHNQSKIIARLDNLEQKFYQTQTVNHRPEAFSPQESEQKAAFVNYIRTGQTNDLITKSFSSAPDEAGAAVVPQLYNRIINEIHALSPVRQIASIETISTNALDILIEDGKFVGGWVGETERRDETDTSKLKQKRIHVAELYAQPKATQRLIDDSAIQIESWLLERLSDCFARLENIAFLHGDGDRKPKGILSEDTGIRRFNAGNTVSATMLLDLIASLREEYVPNATFLMNRRTLAEIQKLKDETGRFIWQPSLSDSLKQTIFGIPVLCASDMPDIKAGAPAIILGDFKAGYKIVDRANINVMRDPYTDKPFVKFYAVKRVGADVVDSNALRIATFE